MVPARLREARHRANLTQEKLGVLVGIDESTARSRISYYESGTNSPSFDTARKIARVLNVPVSYLYTPEDEDELAQIILGFYNAKKNS
ncbi:transcriptional regulator [Candidatus Pantoea alvi]|nr:transcriptional regulator [Pantoea alvi]